MSITTTAQLVQTLSAISLLEPSQLDEVQRSLHATFAEPRALAGELLHRGWLTAFQINQLFQGRGAELVIGPYVLLARLGEGGMGQVFQARHRKLGRCVALKLIRPERLANPDAVQRFAREIRAAAQLRHPNVIHAFDAGQIGDVHFFVMEYVEGSDLAKLVKRQGPLPVALACDYVRQAALGLQHAHERGLVHRDIKPSNLLLVTQGSVVKILDMGLARLTAGSAGGESTLTAEGSVMGTPDYIAPEQALNSHTADIRADLYSLGCTLYFLLTAQPPFPGGQLADKLLRHQLHEPQPVKALRSDIPGVVTAVLGRLMAKQPQDRYQTPAEAAQALDAALNKHAMLAVPVSARTAQNEETVDLAVVSAPVGSKVAPLTATVDPVGMPLLRAPHRLWWAVPVAVLGVVVMAGLLALLWPAPVREVPPEKTPVGQKLPKKEAVTSIFWELGPADNVLPGLVPRPAKLPGLGRWQLQTVMPRGQVEWLAWSPNGKWIASVGGEGVVRVYDVSRGDLVRLFHGHKGPAFEIAWSKDNRWLATVGLDAMVRLWDVESNKTGPTFSGHKGEIRSVTWHPNGKRLASGGVDGTVRLWNVGETESTIIHQGTNTIYSVVWSPDGEKLAWGGTDRMVRIWDVKGAKPGPIFQEHSAAVNSVAWSPDSLQIASASADKTIRLWELDKQETRAVLTAHTGIVTSVVWSLDGKWIVSGSHDNKVRIWHAGEGKPQKTTDHIVAVTSVSLAPNGQSLASGGADGLIRFWGMATEKPVKTIGQQIQPHSVCWSPNAQWITVGGSNSVVRLLEPPSGKLGPSLKYGGWGVAGAPNAARLAVINERLAVWDVATDNKVGMGSDQLGTGSCVAWGDDGRWIAYTDRHKGKIYLWDVDKNQLGPVLDHKSTNVAFHPKSGWLASVGEDGSIRTWSLPDGKPGSFFSQLSGVTYALCWSPDGTRLASLDKSKLAVWKFPEGNVQVNQPVSANSNARLEWSRDGRFLASSYFREGSYGVELLDATNGKTLHTFTGHDEYTASITWSPKGDRIASCARDYTVRVWDVDRKEPVWVVVMLPDQHTATIQAGGRLDVSDPAAESHLVYVVEGTPGSLELLTPREFRHRLGLSAPAK